ncbi:MAG: transcription factor S [archaeon]
MLFCPKCKSLLKPRSEGGKRILGCSCGYKEKNPQQQEFKEKVKDALGVAVIEKEDEQALPVIDADCPKCHHTKAQFWTIQTRASDEPETKFLKCEQCKHVWRDYS